MNNLTDYDILLNEINALSDKWHKRLDYHISEGKKDIHDCYLCSTIVYEIERAKQEAHNKIAEARQKNYFDARISKTNDEISAAITDGTALVRFDPREGVLYKLPDDK